MNHSTLLQNSFHMDGPITTDSDYTATQRQFSGPISFSMDDEDNSRRGSGVGHPLAQPVSIPATNNGLRYNTQQPAMQDVPFATSPTILMSPSDSCSDTFSPASGSIYSHSPGISYDRMPDFRPHRVPPLQPPAGMSSTVQPQNAAILGSSGLLGRNDNYPGTYTLHRGPFHPPLTSLTDTSRLSHFGTTPRALEGSVDRSQNLMFGSHTSLMLEPLQRLSQPMADAPPFHETNVLQPVVAGNQTIKPDIHAKIHKGFFQVDDKWTCYRRNYFSVSCSFTLHPWTHGPLYLKYSEHATERVMQFSMSISAVVNAQLGEPRELVQHTPKRDKQSERRPGKIVLQPCQPQPPPLVLSHGSAASSSPHGFALTSPSAGMAMDYNSAYSSGAQPSQPPTQHTFERIQFQKATANNGKRRAQQQYYNLVVELWAEVSIGGNETQWIKIARRLSHPMVVRGRSPGHYKDGRRDSSTSMGPDGGSGGSGDATGGTVLHPGIGPTPRSHLALMSYDSSQRGGPHYGRPDYHHQMTASDHSPLSQSPHISSSSSSNFDIGVLNDSMDPMDSIKSTSSMDSYPSFEMMDNRKPESQFRSHVPHLPHLPHLHSLDYGSGTKNNEEPGNSFPDTYDSMMAMMPPEQSDSSHYLKQHPPKITPQVYHHHSSNSGYDPVYSARSSDGGGPYCRFQTSQSLCA